MKLGSRSSILNIESVTHGHSGVYTCVAINSAGSDRAQATLIVHGRNKLDYESHHLSMIKIIILMSKSNCHILIKID